MISQALREARRYEEVSEKLIGDNERPAFHLSPRTGWMNDPNGFSYYKGEYHMFYQYNPYAVHWGAMHWGHAVSKDLLNWNYRPAVLAPDEVYDRGGCFSGSALPYAEDGQLIMYTGVAGRHRPDGGFCEVQVQCLAIGNGVDYVKYEHNPVLDEKDLPQGGSIADFRDPKMWQKQDGTYGCVAANCTADHDGQILIFASKDGLRWEAGKVLVKNRKRFGRMWECPDFFSLDGKQVLLVSPQDMQSRGHLYHSGNGTLCLIGDYDETTDDFTEQYSQPVDGGMDFYAPQTTLAPDGRRIMIGWMQNWDTCGHRLEAGKWFGQMSLPRELSVVNGRLIQRPVKELEGRRQNKVVHHHVAVEGTVCLEGIKGRKLDMELMLSPHDEEELYRKLVIRFAQDEQHHVAVSFRPDEAVLKIDRKYSGSRRAVEHQRSIQVNSEKGRLKLRIILDCYSAEIFINDGEQVMTATFYTEPEADGISFLADGKAVVDVIKYDLV